MPLFASLVLLLMSYTTVVVPVAVAVIINLMFPFRGLGLSVPASVFSAFVFEIWHAFLADLLGCRARGESKYRRIHVEARVPLQENPAKACSLSFPRMIFGQRAQGINYNSGLSGVLFDVATLHALTCLPAYGHPTRRPPG